MTAVDRQAAALAEAMGIELPDDWDYTETTVPDPATAIRSCQAWVREVVTLSGKARTVGGAFRAMHITAIEHHCGWSVYGGQLADG
jgi:hypothetical protein